MKTFSHYVKEEVALEYHNDLNPVLWTPDKKLKPEVREALLKIADKWIEFTKIPKGAIKDILLTGGNANYNYTPYSDLDLHVWTDLSKVNKDKELVSEYMNTKKSLWEDKYHITVKGYKVEGYTQPLDEKPHSGQGVYSLKSNKWIQEPNFLALDFKNDKHLDRKVKFYQKRIDDAVDHHLEPDMADKIKERLKSMRNSAVHKGGEFSFENLVFKALRNSGHLEKLAKYVRTEKSKRLSLEHYNIGG